MTAVQCIRDILCGITAAGGGLLGLAFVLDYLERRNRYLDAVARESERRSIDLPLKAPPETQTTTLAPGRMVPRMDGKK